MSKNFKIELIATDLDGTLLTDNKLISDQDLKTLGRLGDRGIVRVVATGRSLFKVNEVLAEETPVDFIVFSSGAGIFDWKNRILLHREYFALETIVEILKHLTSGNINFCIYRPIPENNLFYFHRGADYCPEFENYLVRHEGDYLLLENEWSVKEAGQVMAVIPNDEILFEALKKEILEACENVRVIRTTSPMDDRYIWLEIFPDTVSKGHGIQWLCDYLGLDYSHTLGIGNDYNDLDMFEFVAHPYVVQNGIQSLRKKYNESDASNECSGVSEIINLFV